MRRLTVLVLLFGLALVFQGCKPADACEGLFSGFFGGSSGCGGNYTPAYDPCGGYANDPGYATPIQSSGGCCPETQVQVNPCDPVQKAPVPMTPIPEPQIDLVPQEPDPQMTPVESQDGPEMLPPSILDGKISLTVPAEAVVYINGYRTKKTGTKRTYRSQSLRAGYNYKYNIVIQVGSTKKVGVVTLMGGEKKNFAYHQFRTSQLLARN